MLSKIKEHLETTPFRPFALRTADGREYRVPTIDHIYLPPGSKDVIIANDKGVTVILAAFYITGLVQTSPAAASKTASE